jgi:amino acid transporter
MKEPARPPVPPAMSGPAPAGSGEFELPEPFAYRLKKKLLGPPLVTERLGDEKLNKTLALGVLAPDMISSSAYGTEEMLNQLVPIIGVAAFSLVLPITAAILVVLFFVTLSYREVVMVYTKAGGSYVVSRDNFGPRVAQVAAVALIIDYILTVCVQTAAGSDALTSAFPSLADHYGSLWISLAVVALMAWGNLRGIREAGKMFALPTYLFVSGIGATVVVGLVRAALGQLHTHPIEIKGVSVGHSTGGLVMGATLIVLLRAFANGGASLTGLEAISNGVATFRDPRGRNARRVLVIMSTILGTLVLGVSLIAHFTHAVPYDSGTPTVISQEVKYVFGSHGPGSTAIFFYVQAVTMLILWTGGNTSFNGFPNLASFVAEDAFLPRQLTRRGHRLVFSNGIIILAVLSAGLLAVTRASVSALVAMYAIGVFVGFTMAGTGLVKHHFTYREQGWRHKSLINGSAAVLSALIVGILAVVKFTQGAWLVVVIFPILVTVLIRLHHQYEEEKGELEENAARACEAPVLRRHVVLIFVERLDLATARAIQVARSLGPTEVRAVHFVLDTAASRQLEEQWSRLGLTQLPLDLVDCPDRRLTRAAMELVVETASDGQTEVGVMLPRRVFEGLWRRVLHDRTADRIAGHISQLPNANATIVPFPLGKRNKELVPWKAGGPRGVGSLRLAPSDAPRGRRGRNAPAGPVAGAATPTAEGAPAGPSPRRHPPADGLPDPGDAAASTAASPAGAATAPGGGGMGRLGVPTVPIASVVWRQRARVAGRVHSVRVQPGASLTSLECTLSDGTGSMVLVFQGRRRVPGIEPGAKLLVEGMVGEKGKRPAMINPVYQILAGADSPGHEPAG